MPNMIKLCEGKSIGANEFKYLEQALSAFEISNHGRFVSLFEEKLKEYLKTKKSISVLNSGTSAIHLALLLCGVKKGDEVLCQSFTFCATANPIKYLGAHPVFIDSEDETWNMCPIYLEKAINSRLKSGKTPRAIIVTHSYGMPAKIKDLISIAKKYGIKLIEDAAEALGSQYEGKMCGTIGDYGIISFNANKIITSAGGGALICNSELEKNQIDYFAKQAKEKKEFYFHTEIGYNYKLNNINAAIGLAQLETIQERILLKRKVFEFYKSLFTNKKGIRLHNENEGIIVSNYWINTIRIDNFKLRNKIIKSFETNNIEIRPVWNPMHLQPVYSECLYYGGNQSEKLFQKGLCLPSGVSLENKDFNKITNAINELNYGF